MFERWREYWKASEEELAARESPPGKEALLLFAAAFLVFALLTPRGLPNGDAAVYAQQVFAGDFASRPVHLGYYLLATLMSLGQDVPDRFFSLLSSCFAAATLVVVLALARHFLGPGDDRRWAWAAPLSLAGHAVFLENAVHAEIHSAQTFLLLLALGLWLAARPLAAGLAFGLAGLVTPSSVFFAPAFLLVKRPRLRPLLILAAGAGAMVLAPVLGLRQEYFYGDRGLLTAAGKSLGLLPLLLKEGFELGLGFLAFLPLLALGAWRAARRPALRPLLAAWILVWAATLLGERFRDVPVQLPTWTLAAVFAALGAAELAERLDQAGAGRSWLLVCLSAVGLTGFAGLLVARGWVSSLPGIAAASAAAGLVVLIVAFFLGRRRLLLGPSRAAPGVFLVAALLAGGSVAIPMIAAKNRRIDAYRADTLALGASAAPDFLAIGSWERGILLEHYLFRRSYTEHFLNTAWLEGGWGEERQASSRATLAAALESGRQIWLLGKLPKVAAQLEAAGYLLAPESDPLRRAEKPGAGQ